ncbi:methyltransferase domain-containing protein [Actinomadura xylanilytica]|uniref:methyltransferase domain-containing protein n=1 Tax=Actinomadura xylanilytica TaxID=887459 RepID=UPI00255B0BEF|nr:methyltransferase domain-containing protein [Actinomadura xylanilytica]MDL4777522.1 methyltransferase domain-containing protein [Actinomadura xylanilytica]
MSPSLAQSPPVLDRIALLLDGPPADPDRSAGYLDLLGPAAGPAPTPAQSVMQSRFLPRVYERIWRPVGFNLAKGWPLGPDTAAEHALARDWLGLGRPGSAGRPDATVLDVACGPGNVTRALAAGVSAGGLVVGLDAAATMLARAASEATASVSATVETTAEATVRPGSGRGADPRGAEIGYVRGDAVHLPFLDATFDAVCCFGALYLFDDPWAAIDSMTRVLKPGGRLVVLTTRRPALPVSRLGTELIGRAAGVTMFGDREVVRALTERGFSDVRRRRYPLMQLAGARRP